MPNETDRERASAAIWDWRGEGDWASASDRSARARRGGLLRGGVGLLVAAALALWKPVLGDARSPRIQSEINLKIKFRESFRPFAPSVLAERVSDFFELDRPSPYMLLVAGVREERRKPGPERPAAGGDEGGAEAEPDLPDWVHRVNRPRSDVPAVTHVDHSARIQTVHRETHPAYHRILEKLERLTGYGIVVNTSFNVRGEPIVCTPSDAYHCFMRTGMDHLVLGPFLLHKEDQPEWREEREWTEELELD